MCAFPGLSSAYLCAQGHFLLHNQQLIRMTLTPEIRDLVCLLLFWKHSQSGRKLSFNIPLFLLHIYRYYMLYLVNRYDTLWLFCTSLWFVCVYVCFLFVLFVFPLNFFCGHFSSSFQSIPAPCFPNSIKHYFYSAIPLCYWFPSTGLWLSYLPSVGTHIWRFEVRNHRWAPNVA